MKEFVSLDFLYGHNFMMVHLFIIQTQVKIFQISFHIDIWRHIARSLCFFDIPDTGDSARSEGILA